jgi:hypothetical protein
MFKGSVVVLAVRIVVGLEEVEEPTISSAEDGLRGSSASSPGRRGERKLRTKVGVIADPVCPS